MTRKKTAHKARTFPPLAVFRYKITPSNEPVQSVLEQFPVDARICVTDILDAYDAEDRKLADRLRCAESTLSVVTAFQECPCGCYEGAKKHLSQEEQQRLVVVLAQYLQHITSAESLNLLSDLPQELKRLSWGNLPPAEKNRINRIRAKGGAKV